MEPRRNNWANKRCGSVDLALNQIMSLSGRGHYLSRRNHVNDSGFAPRRESKTVDFTALGHASKFVASGAFSHRIPNSFGQASVWRCCFPESRRLDRSASPERQRAPNPRRSNILGGAYDFGHYQARGWSVATFRWSPSR